VPAPALKDRLSQQWKADHIEETLSRVMEHLAENKIASDTLTIQLGKTLQIDPAKEVFVNNPEADRLLTREYRAPFVVPTEV
jgi:hypothetical protein